MANSLQFTITGTSLLTENVTTHEMEADPTVDSDRIEHARRSVGEVVTGNLGLPKIFRWARLCSGMEIRGSQLGKEEADLARRYLVVLLVDEL